MKLRPLTAFGALTATVAAVAAVPLATEAASTPGPDSLIETVSAARSVYGLHDSAGHTMDTLKVVTDPTTPGRFLGVYHWLASGTYNVGVATSTDLRTWTYKRTVDTSASQPYLAFSPAPKNGPILAEEASSTSHLRFKYWTTVSGFLGTTAAYKTFDAPKTLSSCAEGTPEIRAVSYADSASTITSGSRITVSHHYFANCDTDREAVGTLTNFGTWTTARATPTDDALSAAGASGKHGDRDGFTYGSHDWQLFEGSVNTDKASFTMGHWRNYLYDGTSARQLSVHTAGGSTSFANPSATVASVGGVQSLIVTQFLPSEGAAPGESGELIYWNPLDQSAATPTPTPTPTTTPTPSQTPTPTPTTGTGGQVTKVLTIVEENHSLTQMQAGMPYLYGLAKQYGYATNYTAITHPSEPNYIAIAFGDTMGDTGDHSTARSYQGPTVFSQAVKSGHTAKVYAESMASNCKTSDNSSSYYVKHNPWPSEATPATSGCATGDVPSGTTTSGALLDDVNAGMLPNVGMLVPNICNDAHNCSLATADSWLKGWLPKIMAGPDFRSGKLAVVITADEDDRNSGNKVMTTVLHSSLDGAHKVVSSPLTHYSLTGFYDDVIGATRLRKASTAPSMAGAFGLTTP
jgi:acid phosphatase